MNSVSSNLHVYCNNFANIHIFSLIDVGDFRAWMCKIKHFFYFALTDANDLRVFARINAK